MRWMRLTFGHPDDEGLQPSGRRFMENLQSLGSIAHDLQLVGGALHVRKALFQQHLTVIHDTHMVADIFQFS